MSNFIPSNGVYQVVLDSGPRLRQVIDC